MLDQRDLTILNPTAPDFSLCHPFYGTGLSRADCTQAGDLQLPQGSTQRDYYLSNPRMTNSLPFSASVGACVISVEHAGPDFAAPSFLPIAPDTIRGMAGHIIEKCASQGLGGFVTYGLSNIIAYMRTAGVWVDSEISLTNLGFITVSVTGPNGKYSQPGDRDPELPRALADAEMKMAQDSVLAAGLNRAFWDNYGDLSVKAEEMQRGSDETWWGPGPDMDAVQEMTYECDQYLGSPAVLDCAQLQYQDLGPSSATVNIVPGAPKLFLSKTCGLAISATTPTTLTWTQIQSAANALINACVLDPYAGSSGGKAYYGTPPPHSAGRRAKRQSSSQVSGLNALPPHANATIFAHGLSSSLSCDWEAASRGMPVAACETA